MMFDLGKVTDALASFTGSNAAEGGVHGIVQQLADIGIDATQLQGLGPQEIVDLLAEHGVDIGQIDAGQLAVILSQVGGNSETVSGIGQWLADRLRPS